MSASSKPLFLNLRKASVVLGIPYYRLRRAVRENKIKARNWGGRVRYVDLSDFDRSTASATPVGEEKQPSQVTDELQASAAKQQDPREEWYLVWVLNHGRQIRPQKWCGLDFGERNWRRRSVLAVHKLQPNEIADSLDALADRYPPHRCDCI